MLKSPRSLQKDEEKKQTHIFQPVMQLQMTKDPQKLLKEKSINLQPLKRDETIVEINLRSVVTMDNEPMYFQQAFQGGLVQTTNEYMERQPNIFSDDPDDEVSFVMLFQLFGVPNLNQRAREVRPFKSSLVSSGMFVLVSKYRLFFWVGQDFYSCYLDEKTFDNQSQLISEELLAKLVFVYEQAVNFANV